jgi:hypothetical protein
MKNFFDFEPTAGRKILPFLQGRLVCLFVSGDAHVRGAPGEASGVML